MATERKNSTEGCNWSRAASIDRSRFWAPKYHVLRTNENVPCYCAIEQTDEFLPTLSSAVLEKGKPCKSRPIDQTVEFTEVVKPTGRFCEADQGLRKRGLWTTRALKLAISTGRRSLSPCIPFSGELMLKPQNSALVKRRRWSVCLSNNAGEKSPQPENRKTAELLPWRACG